MTGASGWLADERAQLAAGRILDAAARLFAERGVGDVGMAEVAAAAGCSRATLYRYFVDRGELHRAYVQHEALRVGAEVAVELRGVADPRERLVRGVLAALRRVRARPSLAAWFAASEAAGTATLAQSSDVVDALVRTVVPDPDAARWLVRVIVSLLTVPEADEPAERAVVERFVAPVVLAPGRSRRALR